MAATLPSRMSRSLRCSNTREGSRIVPFWIRSEAILSARLRYEIQHRHPHRQAVRHLSQYPALGTIGDVALNLQPAIHRAGVHDEHALLAFLEPVPRQAKKRRKLSYAGELAAADSLELH